MLHLVLSILYLSSAIVALPTEDLLPGAPPGTSSSVYSPFREINHGRIIGGAPATKGQFAWQAALLLTGSDGKTFCSGALISTTWVVTAAHCLQGVSKAEIRLGIVDLSDSSAVVAQASRVVVHSSFNPSTLASDLAVVQLSISVPNSENIRSIRIAGIGNQAAVTMSGWGSTKDNSSPNSPVLNFIALTTMYNTDCDDTYGAVIGSGAVCTYGSPTANPCNGDSGGPLVSGAGVNAVLVGITSFGHATGCDQGKPTVYVRMSAYSSWVSTNAVR